MTPANENIKISTSKTITEYLILKNENGIKTLLQTRIKITINRTKITLVGLQMYFFVYLNFSLKFEFSLFPVSSINDLEQTFKVTETA